VTHIEFHRTSLKNIPSDHKHEILVKKLIDNKINTNERQVNKNNKSNASSINLFYIIFIYSLFIFYFLL
jgi:hypothetical protein